MTKVENNNNSTRRWALLLLLVVSTWHMSFWRFGNAGCTLVQSSITALLRGGSEVINFWTRCQLSKCDSGLSTNRVDDRKSFSSTQTVQRHEPLMYGSEASNFFENICSSRASWDAFRKLRTCLVACQQRSRRRSCQPIGRPNLAKYIEKWCFRLLLCEQLRRYFIRDPSNSPSVFFLTNRVDEKELFAWTEERNIYTLKKLLNTLHVAISLECLFNVQTTPRDRLYIVSSNCLSSVSYFVPFKLLMLSYLILIYKISFMTTTSSCRPGDLRAFRNARKSSRIRGRGEHSVHMQCNAVYTTLDEQAVSRSAACSTNFVHDTSVDRPHMFSRANVYGCRTDYMWKQARPIYRGVVKKLLFLAPPAHSKRLIDWDWFTELDSPLTDYSW